MRVGASGNTQQVGDTILQVSKRLSDLQPLERTIGLVCQADVDERFNSAPGVRVTGTVYGGETWEALSERYLKTHPKREGGQQLRDTGELAQSFAVGLRGNVLRSTAKEIVFGSALPKARGLHRKRKILFLHSTLIKQVKKVFAAYATAGTDSL